MPGFETEEEKALSMPSTQLPDREADSTYRAPRAALQITDFDIVGRIGDGSFSTVILAKLRGSEDQYAIKIVNKHLVLRNKMADYVRNERNILDQLNHDGIVKLVFTFQDPDSLYFGCEFCAGGDLYEQINRRGKLDLDTTRFYTAEIVQVLEYIRTKQVVHRDLKPENLLLTGDGHLKLTDFGSAKAFFLPPTGGLGKQARATSFVGTAEYVSPEVLNNTPLSYPADLWALGSLIFQMLTGKPPFKAGSEYLTFQKVAEREFEYPADFPSVARDLVDALLVLEPQDRLGASDMSELKAHPFFHGINWDNLRQTEAPDYVPPPGPTPELEGLDWEVTSLVRDTMLPIEGMQPTSSVLTATHAEAVSTGASASRDQAVLESNGNGMVALPGVQGHASDACRSVHGAMQAGMQDREQVQSEAGLHGSGDGNGHEEEIEGGLQGEGERSEGPHTFGWAGHGSCEPAKVMYVRNPEADSESEEEGEGEEGQEAAEEEGQGLTEAELSNHHNQNVWV